MGRYKALAALLGLALITVSGPGRAAGAAPIATLDPSFGSGGVVTLAPESDVRGAKGVVAQNDGLVVSGGRTFEALTSAGALDPAFGTQGTLSLTPAAGAEFSLADFTLAPQGRLVIVGTSIFPAAKDVPNGYSATPVTEPAAVRVFRFLADGEPDPSFGQDGVVETDFGLPPPHGGDGLPLQPQASVGASGVAVDGQGRIVITGSVDTELGPSCEHDIFEPLMDSVGFVARLAEGGAPDPEFGRQGLIGGRGLDETAVHGEGFGRPVVGPDGTVTYTSGGTRCGAGGRGTARLTPDGQVDESFGKEGVIGGDFADLAGTPGGSVIGLSLVPEGEYFGGRVIRIAPDGQVARSFGHRGATRIRLGGRWGDEPNALAVDGRGRIYVGGTYVAPNLRGMFVSRLRPGGRQEMSFGPHGRVVVRVPGPEPFYRSDILLDGEGRVIVMHPFSNSNFTAEGIMLARYQLSN